MAQFSHTFPDFKVDEKKPTAALGDVLAMVKKDGSCVIINNIGTPDKVDLRAFSRNKREILWMRPWCQKISSAQAIPELSDPRFFLAGELEVKQNGQWSHQMKYQLGALLSAPDFHEFFRRKGMDDVALTFSCFDLGYQHQVFGKKAGSEPTDRLVTRLQRLQDYSDQGKIKSLNEALRGTPLQVEVCPWQVLPAQDLSSLDINSLAKKHDGRIPFLGELGEGIVYCPLQGNQRFKLKGEITVDAQIVACCSTPATDKKPEPTLGWIGEETKTGTLFCIFGGINESNWQEGLHQQAELKLLHVQSIDYDNRDKLVKSLQAGNPTFLNFRLDRPDYITKAKDSDIESFAKSQRVNLEPSAPELGL
jgi:hypothetical protein